MNTSQPSKVIDVGVSVTFFQNFCTIFVDARVNYRFFLSRIEGEGKEREEREREGERRGKGGK
jgi:hypothetical protein